MIVCIADRERSETSKHAADRYFACDVLQLKALLRGEKLLRMIFGLYASNKTRCGQVFRL